MKKITFDELHRLICSIDYTFKETYPVSIRVKGKGKFEQRHFDFGIGDVVDDEGNVICEELQYSINQCGSHVVALEDPDMYFSDDIRDDLIEKCGITEDSTIYLYDTGSFNGKKRDIYMRYMADEVRKHYHDCLEEKVYE